MRLIKTYRFLIILFILPSAAYSQGFDWQYSSRLPSSYPRLFAGLSIGYDYLDHFGSSKFLEQKIDIIPCCTFTSGRGNGTSIGIQAEYWKTGQWAYTGGFAYNNKTGSFATEGDNLPQSDGQTENDTIFRTRWNQVFNLSYVNFNAGIKYKPFDGHFHVSGLLLAGIYVASHRKTTETRVSGKPMLGGPDERVALEGDLSGEINHVIINPQLRFGYDFSPGLGLYVTPSFGINFPVMNIASKEELRTWGFSFGVMMFKGMK